MKRVAGFFFGAALLMVVSFLGLAGGQRSRDLRTFQDERALTVARAVAWVDAQAEPAEVRPSQRFVQSIREKVPGLSSAMVLKGTKFLAHTDETRVGKRLDRKSLEDKVVYDDANSLRANVRKNREEQARRPDLNRDAYPEFELDRADGVLDVITVVKKDGRYQAAARIVVSEKPLASPTLPWGVVALALAAGIVFLLVVRKLPGPAGNLAGAALLAFLVWFSVGTLADWRDKMRRTLAGESATTLSVLAQAGLLEAGASTPPGLIATLARAPDGQKRSDLMAIAPSGSGGDRTGSAVVYDRAPYQVLFSEAAFGERRAADVANLRLWGAGLGLIGLLLFILGAIGQLQRAGASVVRHAFAYTSRRRWSV